MVLAEEGETKYRTRNGGKNGCNAAEHYHANRTEFSSGNKIRHFELRWTVDGAIHEGFMAHSVYLEFETKEN